MLAPLAVRLRLDSEHTVADAGLITITGIVYEVRATVLDATQLAALVAVTVYIVLAVGVVTEILAVVAEVLHV